LQIATPSGLVARRVLDSIFSSMHAVQRMVAGAPIPAIGFGVGTAWFAAVGDRQAELTRSLHAALDAGFRHIDEAEMYRNESITGAALCDWLSRNPGTQRASLFITSKIISVDAGVEAVCRRSLAALRLDYLDLYLVHAPFQYNGDPFQTPLVDVWRQMESLVDAGLVRDRCERLAFG